MKELHCKLFNILCWFDDFCKNHNLVYFLADGTMLGASRHQGIIPWDDDLDVVMPIDDYIRFVNLTHKMQFDKYLVESPLDGNNDFPYGFAKVYDTSTTLIERARKKVKRGIYIDVFPLFPVNDLDQTCLKRVQKIYRYRSISYLLNCSLQMKKQRLHIHMISTFLLFTALKEMQFLFHIPLQH